MRIQIFTDAWHPQINGVVTTIEATRKFLIEQGHIVDLVHPGLFKTCRMPRYPDIPVALRPKKKIIQMIKDFKPDAIHIATEGTIGWSTRNYCTKNHIPFSTAIHTRFPEYFNVYWGIPASWVYSVLRRFHRTAHTVMVPTNTMLNTLKARGYINLHVWTRGVDTKLFKPLESPAHRVFDGDEPVLLYVGRICLEKNLPAFLNLKNAGRKVVVGEGPLLEEYKIKYPQVEFVGPKFGEELARYFGSADVLVFPSLTDTFGLVIIEALSCGLPVAAFPVTGPMDVIRSSEVGILDEDLEKAVEKALLLSRKSCRAYALDYSWESASQQFFKNLI